MGSTAFLEGIRTGVGKRWRQLVETSESFENDSARQLAILFEAVLCCVMVGAFVLIISDLTFRGAGLRACLLEFAQFGLLALFLLGLRALNRSGRQMTAAVCLVLFLSADIFMTASTPNGTRTLWVLSYLLWPIIIASRFLSRRFFLMLVTAMLAGVIAIWLSTPGLDPYCVPINFLAITAVLLFLLKRHEEVQEKIRRTELARSEARFRDLIQHADDLVWRIGPDGRFTFVSPVVTRLSGYAPEELEGRSFLEVLDEASAQEARESFRKRFASRYPFDARISLELVHRRKNGTEFIGETFSSPIYDANGQLLELQGITRDITERKRAERERQRLEEELYQSQKMEAVGQLAGGIAHDFNNLLQVITGYTEMATEMIAPDQPGRPELAEIGKAAYRASELVRQLLAFSRRKNLARSTLDVNERVDGIAKMLERILGKSIAIEFIPGTDLPLVDADAGRIEQILLNLCVNARDAMPEGGAIAIHTERILFDDTVLQSSVERRPGCFAAISVADNGIGMDSAVQAHIFEPFFTTKDVGKGTGLGLATAYGIAKQHGGWIECASTVGEGSTFTVYLPESSATPKTPATPE